MAEKFIKKDRINLDAAEIWEETPKEGATSEPVKNEIMLRRTKVKQKSTNYVAMRN